MFVLVNDKNSFSGTFEECKDYITSRFTPTEFDAMGDGVMIVYDTGRAASFILEWV